MHEGEHKQDDNRELLRRAYDALGRCEGLLAARAYREQHEPPFKPGKAWQELDHVRTLLAEMRAALAGGPGG